MPCTVLATTQQYIQQKPNINILPFLFVREVLRSPSSNITVKPSPPHIFSYRLKYTKNRGAANDKSPRITHAEASETVMADLYEEKGSFSDWLIDGCDWVIGCCDWASLDSSW